MTVLGERRQGCARHRVDVNNRRCRQADLRVVAFPQGGGYVPSIRVAGKWLARFGFELGDEVNISATEKRILITRKEDSNNGRPLV